MSDADSLQQTMTKKYAELVNSVRNLDETFITTALMFFIIFIICLLLLYILYTSKLEESECSNMTKMYGDVNGKIKSNTADASDFLCNYYVKTAYNCCSGGSYKNDYVNVCNLKSVLKQGARCLDFEIYSVDGQAVVSTSTADNYYVKETYNYVKFADAMSIIQLYAFGDGAPNKLDPIILHLRFKSNNPEMYKALANIFQSYTTLMLGKQYSYMNKNNNGGNLGLVQLSELKGKIVLVVDESNKSYDDNIELNEYINATSNSGNIRSYPYFGVKNVPDIDELSNFNKGSFMSIVLPDAGVNPPNPSGEYARELGCQFVAMRYQYVDNFLLSDINFFDTNGYAFVQKLENMRYKPVTIDPPIPQNPELSYAQRTEDAPLGVTFTV